MGIWAENANTSNESVTVRNSSVYNVDATGIFIGSGAPPSLAATIDNHVVNASAALAAVDSDSVTGQVVADNISNTLFGVFDTSGLMAGNTIMGSTYGIYLGEAERWGQPDIGLEARCACWGSSTMLSGNRICSGRTAGAELVCFAANFGGNLMNDAPVGVDAAPAPAAIGANTFANTPNTIVPGACAVAAAALRTSRVMTTTRANANVIVREQWHTPAT